LVGVPLGAAAGTLGVGKIISVVAVVVAAGAGTVAAVHHASGPSHAAAAVSARRDGPFTPPGRPAPPSATPPPSPAPAPAPPPIVVARTAPPAPAPPTEPQLVRDAWTALESNHPTDALRIIERATQQYPHGVLDEERDAVHIVALTKLHRLDDARAAA